MKKKIFIIVFSILLVIGLLIILKYNNKVYTEIDGVKYAILVDGTSSTSFPSGNYKVDINCTNADAYWNNVDSKVVIKNIEGNITCDISFNSITNSDYLNTYITNLSGTVQGDGYVIHEMGEFSDYISTSTVKTFGTTPVYFQNTSQSSITQTNVDSYWSFSNGTFTSIPSKFTFSGTNNRYHVYTSVQEDGYYRLCYTIEQVNDTGDIFYIYVNTSSIKAIYPQTSGSVSGCYDLGYIETTDYINISEHAWNGTSAPVVTFSLEKDNNLTNVDTGYRYEGKNPNNYVLFNNELWRIIGVFETEYDSNNDGIADATENLVKIIREEQIGGLVWDKNEDDDWPNSSLYHLLNEQYYDWSTNSANIGTYCYSSSSVTSTCDYSAKGINNDYRGMIAKAKWYLGGGGETGYTTYKPLYMYRYERDANSVQTGNSASVFGYIGLMYESDYLYGVLATDCPRATTRGTYSTNCASNDWLYGKGVEWTITSDSFVVSSLNIYGNVVGDGTGKGYVVRPVLYLSPSVYRVGGSGSITDPYIIGIPTEYVYWNDNYELNSIYTKTQVPTGSGPRGVFDSYQELANAGGDHDAIAYIKTKIVDGNLAGHNLCVMVNDNEMCMGPDYIVPGDSDGTLTAAKIRNDMIAIFGYTEDDFIGSGGNYSQTGDINCGWLSSDYLFCNFDCSGNFCECDLSSSGQASCYFDD